MLKNVTTLDEVKIALTDKIADHFITIDTDYGTYKKGSYSLVKLKPEHALIADYIRAHNHMLVDVLATIADLKEQSS